MTLNMQMKYKNGKLVSRGIEWTDATWNPISGCLHNCRWEMPDGDVAICYAENVAEKVARSAYKDGFSHHYWKPHYLDSPMKQKESLKIFVGSMADIFGHWVPEDQISSVLRVIAECPHHQFQMLTKNPARARSFQLPDNVWLGASTPPDFMWGKKLSQSQRKKLLYVTLKSLENTRAKIKWLSIEPLSWDVAEILEQYSGVLNWAVVGAATNGRKAYQPESHWVENVLSVLDDQNVNVFFKGNLEWKPWREEFPEITTTN